MALNRFDIALGKKPPKELSPQDRSALLCKAHLCIAIMKAQGTKGDEEIEAGALKLMPEAMEPLLELYEKYAGKEYVYEKDPDHGRTGSRVS